MIRSFSDIFEIWTIKELSERLPAKYPTVAGMKLRGWVAAPWWGRLIEIARQDGHMLDADMLLAFARQRAAHNLQREEVAKRASKSPPVYQRSRAKETIIPRARSP